jgi:hypothetical protein
MRNWFAIEVGTLAYDLIILIHGDPQAIPMFVLVHLP